MHASSRLLATSVQIGQGNRTTQPRRLDRASHVAHFFAIPEYLDSPRQVSSFHNLETAEHPVHMTKVPNGNNGFLTKVTSLGVADGRPPDLRCQDIFVDIDSINRNAGFDTENFKGFHSHRQ